MRRFPSRVVCVIAGVIAVAWLTLAPSSLAGPGDAIDASVEATSTGYTYTIRNTGTTTLTNVLIGAPPGTAFTGAQSSNGTCQIPEPNSIICNMNLAPGQSMTVTGQTANAHAGSQHVVCGRSSGNPECVPRDATAPPPPCGERPGAAIVGTPGNDTLTGTAFDEDLSGLDGNDSMEGADGEDSMDGGRGDDTMSGGPCRDALRGRGGRDTMDGGEDRDRVLGGAGNDRRVLGGAGNDFVEGGPGNDARIDGGDGDDRVEGDQGNDSLRGGNGDDTMLGSSGSDEMIDGDGADRVFGGRGDDVFLAGDGRGDGRDRLSGTEGRDYFETNDGERDYVNCGRGRDWVRFWDKGVDRLISCERRGR